MDAAVHPSREQEIRTVAMETEGVLRVGKCRIRKSGLGLLMDIHIGVDGAVPVRDGHEIAHRVKDRLMERQPQIHDVVVHVEPDEY
jgi:divalent metal cation (Fe/Co/Zn/Cd) transporter